MKSSVYIAALILLYTLISFGQERVEFTLDLTPMVQDSLFIPGPESKVYVRGSFNDWSGTDFELHHYPGSYIYRGTFHLPFLPGDTIDYKFVIEKQQGAFFWEGKADPSNPDHYNRQFVMDRENITLPVARFQPDEYFTYPVVFSREDLKADFLQMRNILEETHPALYDYTDKRTLDSLFNLNYSRIDGDLQFSPFLMLMTEVIAQVGCGHSSMWVPGAFWKVAPPELFPLMLHIEEGERPRVKGFYADTGSVPAGSEILAINGEPAERVVDRLVHLTSADGLNSAFRRAKVAQHFSVKYALAFGFRKTFHLKYLVPGEQLPREINLTPVSKNRIDRCTPEHSELSFKELDEGRTGVLTINTFGYYDRVDMFRSFLDSVFNAVDRKGMENLILDLRGNGGGDPFCASYLWAYLEPEPLPYFDDHYGRYDTLANPVPQPSKAFNGELYTLIDGLGFSTTGHFCGLLKYHRVGRFVGSEMGATYTCTGNATYPALNKTGIMVGTARVMRYTAAVKNMDPRRGIIPDYPVKIRPEDLAYGTDPVFQKALSLTREEY